MFAAVAYEGRRRLQAGVLFGQDGTLYALRGAGHVHVDIPEVRHVCGLFYIVGLFPASLA